MLEAIMFAHEGTDNLSDNRSPCHKHIYCSFTFAFYQLTNMLSALTHKLKQLASKLAISLLFFVVITLRVS